MKPTKTFIPTIVLECAAMTRLTPEERKTFLAILRRVFTEAHMKAADSQKAYVEPAYPSEPSKSQIEG